MHLITFTNHLSMLQIRKKITFGCMKPNQESIIEDKKEMKSKRLSET